MKRAGLFAALVAIVVPLSNGWAQGIVIEQRPVPLEIISQDVKRGAYIPLEDVARALGSSLEFDPRLKRYSVRPTGGGVLKHDPGRARGIVIQEKPSPVAASFAVGDGLVSKGIIIIGGGKPHIPLDDLAAAMNSTVQRSDEGRWTLIPRPGAGPGFLSLSEHGIIIIDNQPQR